MDADYLQHQLELWKRWLYICVGASVTFLAFGIRAAMFDTPAGLGYLILLLGIALSGSYLWLKRVHLTPSEEMFP
ncbi:MAG TPA: hypothetical protein VI451_03710 [Anaerolineales bacterium]|jgi:hypothetical protein|nr:hypothetical protein [Anaerolineales bacterium]